MLGVALARIGQKEDYFNLDWLQNYMPYYLQNFISNKALIEGNIYSIYGLKEYLQS